MTVKRILTLCLAVVFLATAMPGSAEAKKKDGPDEPKLVTVLPEHASPRP